MEIVFVIAILAAFVLGAHVRRPFRAARPEVQSEQSPDVQAGPDAELERLLSYTGYETGDE